MSIRHVHLIGVCGTAMASLAGMLKARGFHVSGSDAAAYPPMSDFLAKVGVPVSQPFAEANLSPRPDLIVVGNAISRGNVELESVLDQRLPITSMADLLYREFLHDREVLVIAGTHGKTTTTSMLSWIFHVAQRNPSFLIGGIAENFGSSFAVSDGREFIIEGDEYDTAFFDKGPKFLHYFPSSAVLTSVEFDHADIYKSLDDVKTSFKRLVNLIPGRGRLVAWDGHPNVDECVARAFCAVERYGLRANSFWRVVDMEFKPGKTAWSILRGGQLWARFEFSLAGEYNVLNATAAAALASHYGVEQKTIANALASFQSVKRRLEVKAEIDGVTIIDDFAHHPTAIAETLKALRARYAGRRLWAILEPRSNTLRRNVFQNELVKSLKLADRVVLAGIFKSEAIPESERLDPAAVVARLTAEGVPAELHPTADEIVAATAPQLRSGDVVAILSNGGFGGIYSKLPDRIGRRS